MLWFHSLGKANLSGVGYQRRIQKIRNGGGATGGRLRQNKVLAVCTERSTGKNHNPPPSIIIMALNGGGRAPGAPPPPKSAPGYGSLTTGDI